MATQQATIDFLLEQISLPGAIRTRKMFGEYALYYNDKVVAFICDDKLYLKPTTAGRKYIGKIEEAPAYPGSKMYYYISGDQWENREWLSELIIKTAEELPLPKKK